MSLEFTEEIDFVTFVWRIYRIDLKGYTEDQLTDIKIQFAMIFIDAPEHSFPAFQTWTHNALPWIKDPSRVVKIQYKKYMPISNTRIPVHPNKFKRIFKTKKHV